MSRDIGHQHVVALEQYLAQLKEAGQGLPERGNKVNVTAVALACGFAREVLYQNPRCKALLQQASSDLGLSAAISAAARDDERAALEREVHALQQRNAALSAEVFELRQRLQQVEHIETHLVDTGRRIIP